MNACIGPKIHRPEKGIKYHQKINLHYMKNISNYCDGIISSIIICDINSIHSTCAVNVKIHTYVLCMLTLITHVECIGLKSHQSHIMMELIIPSQ